ncbi:MAG: transposase [Thermoanaerobaculia bacterium]
MATAAPGHPFYERLDELLARHEFDAFVEVACERFYAPVMGRPSLAPGIYFRLLLVGYFEGIDSERGIAWRVADALSLRDFLGLEAGDRPRDHSTLSRTRRLMDVETHDQVFTWVVELLAKEGLLWGKRFGFDATTLEANAAMRSIVRRDSGATYTEFLAELAQASGVETPTREDLARLDRKRKKKTSNKDWHNPHDPDARITKMKDGRTRLAHKAEQAVDLETGAVVAVTVQPADRGDTASFATTLQQTIDVIADIDEAPEAAAKLADAVLAEVVMDKGYHGADVLVDCADLGIRTYVSEPDRGRRRWRGKHRQRDATYANRRRIRGRRGKRLMRQRAELAERGFAHCYDSGGMRRLHLRGRDNVAKRVLVQVAGFNLGLVMRRLVGAGRPRAAWILRALAYELTLALQAMVRTILTGHAPIRPSLGASPPPAPTPRILVLRGQNPTFTTAC